MKPPRTPFLIGLVLVVVVISLATLYSGGLLGNASVP